MVTTPNRRQLEKIAGGDQDLLRLLEKLFLQISKNAADIAQLRKDLGA